MQGIREAATAVSEGLKHGKTLYLHIRQEIVVLLKLGHHSRGDGRMFRLHQLETLLLGGSLFQVLPFGVSPLHPQIYMSCWQTMWESGQNCYYNQPTSPRRN